MTTAKQLNFRDAERRARRMDDAALLYSIRDAREAASAAQSIADAGYGFVDKDAGYYLDEIHVFIAELNRRGYTADQIN